MISDNNIKGIMEYNIERYNKPDIREVYGKMVNIIMKSKTEEQLNNAERCLRNYERLVQNSYLYPTISKSFVNRTVNDLLSLIGIKRKAYLDL